MSQREVLRRAVAFQHCQCWWCGRLIHANRDLPLETGARATREHLLPKSLGGRNGFWNVVAACHPCNNARGAALWQPHVRLLTTPRYRLLWADPKEHIQAFCPTHNQRALFEENLEEIRLNPIRAGLVRVTALRDLLTPANLVAHS